MKYLGGVRKRYLHPFAFFTIIAAISLLVFNAFLEDYLSFSREVNNVQMEFWADKLQSNPDPSNPFKDPEKLEEFINDSMQTSENVQKFILKYYNLFSFLLLPVYALIAYLTYRKPYHFGEHLVITTYPQGIASLFFVVLFLLSLWLHPILFALTYIVMIGYYSYAYTRLYKHSFAKCLLMLLKFLGLTVLAGILLFVIGILIGFLSA